MCIEVCEYKFVVLECSVHKSFRLGLKCVSPEKTCIYALFSHQDTRPPQDHFKRNFQSGFFWCHTSRVNSGFKSSNTAWVNSQRKLLFLFLSFLFYFFLFSTQSQVKYVVHFLPLHKLWGFSLGNPTFCGGL